MLKENYAAWKVDPADFSHDWPVNKKLEFFARYGILAPSGHNTQPWSISVTEKSLSVTINRDHYLSIDGSGLLSVEPYISIGTFIGMFRLAAQGFGYEIKEERFPGRDQVARLSIAKTAQARPDLLDAIVSRVSNRTPFAKTAISPSDLAFITGSAAPGIKVLSIIKRDGIRFMAEQTKIAIKSIMNKPAYRQELSEWVRPNHTRKFDGMPGFTHGFGFVKSLLSKPAILRGAKLGPQAEHSAELIENSGALVIVCCQKNTKDAFVNAGVIYSFITINAVRTGIASSALGAAVLDTETREAVKEYFDIKDRPIYVLRLGNALRAAKHAPRWPLENLLSRSD